MAALEFTTEQGSHVSYACMHELHSIERVLKQNMNLSVALSRGEMKRYRKREGLGQNKISNSNGQVPRSSQAPQVLTLVKIVSVQYKMHLVRF